MAYILCCSCSVGGQIGKRKKKVKIEILRTTMLKGQQHRRLENVDKEVSNLTNKFVAILTWIDRIHPINHWKYCVSKLESIHWDLNIPLEPEINQMSPAFAYCCCCCHRNSFIQILSLLSDFFKSKKREKRPEIFISICGNKSIFPLCNWILLIRRSPRNDDDDDND